MAYITVFEAIIKTKKMYNQKRLPMKFADTHFFETVWKETFCVPGEINWFSFLHFYARVVNLDEERTWSKVRNVVMVEVWCSTLQLSNQDDCSLCEGI